MARRHPAPRKIPKGEEPEDKRPKPRRGMLRYTLLAGLIWFALAGGLGFSHWVSELPSIAGLMAAAPTQDVTLLDVKGRVIGRRGLTQGEFVTAGELPAHVTDAFIAIEDRRFRYHIGVDPIGMARALFVNVGAGGFV